MSLFRTAAHAAVASSVHTRVQRRQRDRWAGESQTAPPLPAATPVVVADPVLQQSPAVPAVAPVDAEALLSALERLAALRQSGILTDAEFDQQKARILAS